MSVYARFFRPNLPCHIDCLVEVEKMAWSSPGENIEASREKLALRAVSYPGHQSVVLAMVDGAPAGSQYAFQFDWDGRVDSLTSWDEITAFGWTNKVHRAGGKTGFLVGVGVVPKFRGVRVAHKLRWRGEYKISELLIAKTLDNLFRHGAEKVIANARIPFYCRQPGLGVCEYCALRQPDGKLFDPVLRFHERMGAKVIKPVEYSMEDAESLNAGCWVLYQHRFERYN